MGIFMTLSKALKRELNPFLISKKIVAKKKFSKPFYKKLKAKWSVKLLHKPVKPNRFLILSTPLFSLLCIFNTLKDEKIAETHSLPFISVQTFHLDKKKK